MKNNFKYRNSPELVEQDGAMLYKNPIIYDETKRLSVENAFNCMEKYIIKYFNKYKNDIFRDYIGDILFMGEEPIDILSWTIWEDVVSNYLKNNKIKNPELSVVDAYIAVSNFIYDYFDNNKYNDYLFSETIAEAKKIYNNENLDKTYSKFKKTILKYCNLTKDTLKQIEKSSST